MVGLLEKARRVGTTRQSPLTCSGTSHTKKDMGASIKAWSDEQHAIFGHAEDGDAGNLMVTARAGTGKSTSMEHAMTLAPERKIVYLAFNKKNVREMQPRIRDPRIECKTCHSLGFAYVRRNRDGVRIDDEGESAARYVLQIAGKSMPAPMLKLATKLLSLGKNIVPLAQTGTDLMDVAYNFDCVPDEEWEEDGWTTDRICDVVAKAMDLTATSRDGLIDFDDMLFLPVRNRWVRPWFDLVVVDECQDLNAAQIMMVRGASKGRTFAIGDDRQAIYQFRGADSDSMGRLRAALKPRELTLTTTYRCPKSVVSLAAVLVPDYRAADAAPEGTVREINYEKLVSEVAVGDFVLSRKNAPLAPTCLAILRAGKRAKIEGRDVGAGLKALVRRLAKGKASDSMAEFGAKLDRWVEREVGRAQARGEKGKNRADYVMDQADTLRGLSEGLSSVRELATRIDELFAEGDAAGPRVVCSTVHRAKGLEANRVFMLVDTFRSTSCYAAFCGDAGAASGRTSVEEENLEYVAVTRAQRELVFVRGEAKKEIKP